MKEELDKILESDAAVKADFEAKIKTVDFAKKTLGQMAFLCFLKEGMVWVAPGKPWGTGPKTFCGSFQPQQKVWTKLFDNVLEPLYEALAQDRGVEAIYPRLNNCRMPFLNGGLLSL